MIPIYWEIESGVKFCFIKLNKSEFVVQDAFNGA